MLPDRDVELLEVDDLFAELAPEPVPEAEATPVITASPGRRPDTICVLTPSVMPV
jgi:hypothetical protein